MVYCIGLTGNIASGKSTVALLFNQLGVPVFNADTVSKKITLRGSEAYNEIVSHFGPGVLTTPDEQLDRKKLRAIIFSNAKERIWLENLLHPKIRQELEKEVSLCTGPYCVVEIPLLKNKSNYPYINRILVVTSSVSVQVQRIIKRDKCTEEHALAIIATQPSIQERLNSADDTLINDEEISELERAVERLHHNYLKLASRVDH
jgi:dephospho-CoA kinase